MILAEFFLKIPQISLKNSVFNEIIPVKTDERILPLPADALF